jgi:hypothetical protein
MKRHLHLNRLVYLIIAATISCGSAMRVLGQDSATNERGFQPGNSYALSNIESINTVNGNVGLRFPLASLPVGRGGFTASINLLYNSKLYDSEIAYFRDENEPCEMQGEDPGVLVCPYYQKRLLKPSEDGGWRYGMRRLLKPTEWDMKAVAEDLIAYVQTARLIKATPRLRFMNGKLVAVSGEPFVRAAQEVIPPLKEVVCLIEEPEEIVRHAGLSIVTASEMLDEHPIDEMYHAVEMLAFTRTLTNEERNAVEDAVSGFFKEVSANRASYGGNYSSISSFDWDNKQRKVKWTWLRNDQFGRHALMFLSLLRDLNANTAPLSSWNGLALQAEFDVK